MELEEIKYKMLQRKTIALNKDQRYAYELMALGKSIFITGAGGTGKTSCIKMFYNLYKNSKNIAMTSTTGTSAILFNGTTLHSFLGIGLGKGTVKNISDKILDKKYILKRWTKLNVLIIDEISMLSPILFDKLEETARIVRNNSLPFGGIQLILSGDFCQLPCIDSNEFCFSANSWNNCVKNTCYLTEIIRQSDQDFQNCLNEVRIAQLGPKSISMLQSRVGVELTNSFGVIPTRLYPLNKDVDDINTKELDKLAITDSTFYQYDIEFKVHSSKNVDFIIEKYKKHTIAPETLQLVVGALVMLIHNLDIDSKRVNGSRGIVIGFSSDIPIVKFVTGEERLIDYHVWEIEECDTKILTITQIPLKLAWACSIHKSQGCSLDYVEIDLGNIFEYGQSYCGLSRVKTIEGLSILSLDLDKIRAHPDAVEYYNNLLNIKKC